jgi:hypothetical protein
MEKKIPQAAGNGSRWAGLRTGWVALGVLLCAGSFLYLAGVGLKKSTANLTSEENPIRPQPALKLKQSLRYQPRQFDDEAGYGNVLTRMKPWSPKLSLEQVAEKWEGVGYKHLEELDHYLATAPKTPGYDIVPLLNKASLYLYEGKADEAYKTLAMNRRTIEGNDQFAEKFLFTNIFYQGVAGLRKGENDNCIMCRGESSCIFPISKAAVHKNTEGSSLAVAHFTEYLQGFPDDLEARWLLNLAHMTLGEYPEKVDPKYRLNLDRYTNSEFDIGRFHDLGSAVGVNRFNQSGGAIMEDFDNDGFLDLVATSFDPGLSMIFHRNLGDGMFENRSEQAGVKSQLGGLNCVQTDYNNDGFMDIYVPRGAWIHHAVRPSLLKNNGDGTFTDVTKEAGLLHPTNSNSAGWADFDNDGWLDLFVCCEEQPNQLFHNNGDGTFTEMAHTAGVAGDGKRFCKGSTWADIDNDDDPDLFLNNLFGEGQLFRNMGEGKFHDISAELGIDAHSAGFSCWSWDYDNDGWQDIFATCFDRTLKGVVQGLIGEPHQCKSNHLFRNLEGKGFQDVTKEAGLDMVFSCMGSNFADLDNDGFLDMYLGTGDPKISMLIPNRMFRNVDGTRFSEITVSSGTGHLQKGHGVACGDWDRDGNIDLFVEVGGAVPGDCYHNLLFQNPGHDNAWVTLKLVGEKSNRAAIGAKIKITTAGEKPMTIYRTVCSGSSFGANPLQQTIGLGKAEKIAELEIYWPTTKSKQVFKDVDVGQSIEIKEFATDFVKLNWTPIDLGNVRDIQLEE